MRPSHRRHNRAWPRMSWWKPAYCTVQSTADILRRLWVSKDEPEMAKPWSAVLAYKRHWIDGGAYSAIPLVPTGRITKSLASMLDEPSPLLGLLPKRKTA